MSTPGAGAAPATQSPSPGRPAPAGVVTLIVGEVGRAGSSRSRARPGASRADAAKASGQPALQVAPSRPSPYLNGVPGGRPMALGRCCPQLRLNRTSP